MSESGPIKKTQKDLDAQAGFSDLQQLGNGLWRASRGGRHYLLKCSKNPGEGDGLLRREYGIGASLQHPFIVRTLDFLPDSPVGSAIVLEYVEGCTLQDYLKTRPGIAGRRKILSQLLSAVEYLHNKGILHNDLKPENMMVTAVGNDLLLIDFGLSETSADYMYRRLGGTAGFSAPEVMRGDTGITSKASSDIYALGAVIKALFPHRYGPVIHKCRRNAPKDRYPDIRSLRKALHAADAVRWIAPSMFAAVLIAFFLCIPAPKNSPVPTATPTPDERIRADLTEFYRMASDSIARIPYQEFAYAVRNDFVEKTARYRAQCTAEEGPACDSIYARLLSALSGQMMAMPSFEELHRQGQLSDKAAEWYLQRTISGKGYAPFEQKDPKRP